MFLLAAPIADVRFIELRLSADEWRSSTGEGGAGSSRPAQALPRVFWLTYIRIAALVGFEKSSMLCCILFCFVALAVLSHAPPLVAATALWYCNGAVMLRCKLKCKMPTTPLFQLSLHQKLGCFSDLIPRVWYQDGMHVWSMQYSLARGVNVTDLRYE